MMKIFKTEQLSIWVWTWLWRPKSFLGILVILSIFLYLFQIDSIKAAELVFRNIPASKSNSGILIAFHGYGGNRNIIDFLKQEKIVTDELIGFDFPDHDIGNRDIPLDQIKYGTIQELLPAFSILKKFTVDSGNLAIHLYGFSAGGGAIINLIAILNQTRFDSELGSIGIHKPEKTQILKAIENGYVMLDCPLKSMDEILAFRKSTPELEMLASRYKKNELNPIDSLKYFRGLKLKMLVHFQIPDDVLSNRDDALFIARLKHYNQGYTKFSFGRDGARHSERHPVLWKTYSTFKDI